VSKASDWVDTLAAITVAWPPPGIITISQSREQVGNK
jgi:hypothetical protein